jgi:hypothetical protein
VGDCPPRRFYITLYPEYQENVGIFLLMERKLGRSIGEGRGL